MRPADEIQFALAPWEQAPPAMSLAGLVDDATLTAAARAYLRTVRDLEDLVGSCAQLERRTFKLRARSDAQLVDAIAARLARAHFAPRQDRLLQLAGEATRVLRNIAQSPRVKPARRYEKLPLAKVREQDTRCLMQLARMPGRTLGQKTATARKAPAVLRYLSVDTSENRLTARVAAEFRRAARARLEHEAAGARLEVLSPLHNLHEVSAHLLEETELGALPFNMRPEPNNALLSHPDYQVVWELFGQLRRREQDFGRLWLTASLQLPNVVAWLIRARLAASPAHWQRAALVDINLYLEEGQKFFEPSGKTLFSILDIEQLLPMSVVLREGDEVDTLDMHLHMLDGEHFLKPQFSQRIRLHFDLQTPLMQRDSPPQDSASPARGLALSVTWLDEEAACGRTWHGFADLPGLHALAQWVCEQAGIQVGEVAARAPQERVAEDCLGVDLVHPRCVMQAGERSIVADEPTLWADAPTEAGDGARDAYRHLLPWVGGDVRRTVSTPQQPWQVHGLGSFWRGAAFPEDVGPEDAGDGSVDAGAAMERVLGAHCTRGTQLAVGVPDYLDEVDARQLRRWLPTSRRAWLVWRSVAAAMAWRNESAGGAAMQAGDGLLVLDTDGPMCTATLLVGRRDVPQEDGTVLAGESEGDGRDDWYWERSAPWVLAGSESRDASSYAMLERLVDDLLTPLAQDELCADVRERLLGQGDVLCAQLDGAPRVISLPVARGESMEVARLTLTQDALTRSQDDFVEAVSAWIDAVSDQDFTALIHQRLRDTAQLHVLLVGAGFSPAPVRETLVTHVSRRLPDAQVHHCAHSHLWVALGGHVFLERFDAGLPTWRDLLPGLSLEVQTTMGPQLISLLDDTVRARGIRPGEVLQRESAELFVIPPGRDFLELPLQSGGGDAALRQMYVRVEHEAFPLRDAVKVRAVVHYRYAEDAFRLYLRPVESADFREIEVEWRRGKAADQQREVQNLAPQFPAQTPWHDLGAQTQKQYLNELAEFADKLKDAAREFKVSKKMHHRVQQQRSEVLVELDDVMAVAKALQDFAREAFGTRRQLIELPPEVQKHVQSIARDLCAFGRIPAEASAGKGRKKSARKKHPLHRPGHLKGIVKLLQTKDSKEAKLIDQLEMACLGALSRLRILAPTGVAQFVCDLVDAQEQPQAQQTTRFDDTPWLEALGRMLDLSGASAPDAASGEVVDWLVQRLDAILNVEDGATVDLRKLRNVFWALTTALWSVEGAAAGIGELHAGELLARCQQVGDGLVDAWSEQGIVIELFHEWGLTLLALARRRNLDDPQDAFFHARGADSRILVEKVHQIDRALRAQGRERNPRVRFEQEDTDEFSALSDFATMLVETLQGYRAALITLDE